MKKKLLLVILCISSTIIFAQKTTITSLSFSEYNEKVFLSNGIVVVIFTADWVGPYKKIQPDIELLASNNINKIKFYIVDVDKESNLVELFHIKSVPLFYIYNSQKLVKTFIGGNTIDAIKETLNNEMSK